MQKKIMSAGGFLMHEGFKKLNIDLHLWRCSCCDEEFSSFPHEYVCCPYCGLGFKTHIKQDEKLFSIMSQIINFI